MAEAFLGLKVSVLLQTGVKLEGTVSHIEPTTQQMTLKDVTLFFSGQPPHYTPVYGVVGKDITDLQVLAAAVPTSQPQQSPTVNPNMIQSLDNHLLENLPPPIPQQQQQQQYSEKILTPVKSVSKNRKSRQPQPSASQQPSQQAYRKRNSDGWAGEDVDIFREEEFDFQKNLDMFDKAKVFAEIRESDKTAPEELLVTLNRLPQKKVNLLPTENVLEVERNVYHEDEEEEEEYDDDDEGEFGDESDDDSQTPDEFARRIKRKSLPLKRLSNNNSKTTSIVTAVGGIACPSVSPLQMAHVEHECVQVSDSFGELAIENGGRGTSLLALQVLSKMDVVSPSVVILAGNNKNGALGLVAARHLVNHGCLVTVCITANKENLCNAVMRYEAMASRFGVVVTYTVTDLGESDLVVDAILGVDDKLIDIQDQSTFDIVCNTIEWANRQPKPVLSIDFPSGIDASTGIPHHPDYTIHPKWTICLGAPKTGCKSSNITGDLYLVDVGVPRLCWKRVGIKGNTIPWGADFLVALQYDTA
ncbi:RNA-dependent ATPase rok1 [Mucor velutinosus]|uniref:Enhancer of mRNA-decapping protein 3 n=1 Tax=Mucor velutinosus TaxID=708070 RepID=A0AAN7DG92_9FUNG|nr:RNA-dependent ATPase rok1 [Mucor velutinosus]